jgi:hypothetical protein
MKTWESGGIVPPFLTFVLDAGDEQSASTLAALAMVTILQETGQAGE